MLPSINLFLYPCTGKDTIIPLIRSLENKTGHTIELDSKTIKRALTKQENTPRTQAKLHDFFSKIAEKTGTPQPYHKIFNNIGTVYSYWPQWLALSKYTDNNFSLDLYPETRKLIRDMAYWERDKTTIVLERYSQAPDRLRFFAEDESRRKWIPDIIRKNLLDSLSNNTGDLEIDSIHFKLWSSHMSLSVVLRILAWFDVEYTQAILKKYQYQESPRCVSFIEHLLPQQRGQYIIYPVRSLFETWRKRLVSTGKIKKSWEAIATFTNDSEKRVLDRWLSGEHIPNGPYIQGFLRNVQAIDDNVDWIGEYMWFRIAATFQRLCQSLEKYYSELSKEEIVSHFEPFQFHSQEALEIFDL